MRSCWRASRYWPAAPPRRERRRWTVAGADRRNRRGPSCSSRGPRSGDRSRGADCGSPAVALPPHRGLDVVARRAIRRSLRVNRRAARVVPARMLFLIAASAAAIRLDRVGFTAGAIVRYPTSRIRVRANRLCTRAGRVQFSRSHQFRTAPLAAVHDPPRTTRAYQERIVPSGTIQSWSSSRIDRKFGPAGRRRGR